MEKDSVSIWDLFRATEPKAIDVEDFFQKCRSYNGGLGFEEEFRISDIFQNPEKAELKKKIMGEVLHGIIRFSQSYSEEAELIKAKNILLDYGCQSSSSIQAEPIPDRIVWDLYHKLTTPANEINTTIAYDVGVNESIVFKRHRQIQFRISKGLMSGIPTYYLYYKASSRKFGKEMGSCRDLSMLKFFTEVPPESRLLFFIMARLFFYGES